ncbi:MAG: hypothetical protein HXS50_04630 [Theionarchaea archaeon]|nr:hypothetical protein [Theionarchaea archaeon]
MTISNVKGVFPHITVMAKGVGSRTEAGIGALMPWADGLWAVGYVSHIAGEGLGLYEIQEDMTLKRHEASVTGTFANRMVHWPSDQAFIGPHAIDASGRVRTVDALKNQRLAATIQHLDDPEDKVYFLTMEGLLYEVNVDSLQARKLFDLVDELKIPAGANAHFKDGFCADGRLIVTNNTYEEEEFLGSRNAGRLAEWEGEDWRIIEENPFVGAGGGGGPNYGGPTIYATGWSRSSAILRMYSRGKWSRYLLPKASQCFDHTWNTEWFRIRHAQTERFLMDLHGMFYELPPFAYKDRVWGIRPICVHLRLVPDFCHWRGMFVMAGDQIDKEEGQPQSGLWFGNIDELWQMGRPSGWGGPWWEEDLPAESVSDPYLMTGFDRKVVHLANDSDKSVRFTLEVDFLGSGSWKEYDSFSVAGGGYVHHEFSPGFSAHWARISVDNACRATAYFTYT